MDSSVDNHPILTREFLGLISATTTIDQPQVDDLDPLCTQIGVIRRCWRYERGCNMLLPYPQAYLEPILEFIRQQEECIAEGTYKDEQRTLYELEIERLRYLINDLHRVRLRKIELKPLYYAYDQVGKDKLSTAELQFAEGYAKIVQGLMKSGLEGLPGKYSFEGLQYESPDDSDVVLLQYLPKDGASREITIPNQRAILYPNTLVVAPYSDCVDLIEDGELDVI